MKLGLVARATCPCRRATSPAERRLFSSPPAGPFLYHQRPEFRAAGCRSGRAGCPCYPSFTESQLRFSSSKQIPRMPWARSDSMATTIRNSRQRLDCVCLSTALARKRSPRTGRALPGAKSGGEPHALQTLARPLNLRGKALLANEPCRRRQEAYDRPRERSDGTLAFAARFVPLTLVENIRASPTQETYVEM